MLLLPPPSSSSSAATRIGESLLRAGVAAVRGVVPRETARAAAAEIDQALQVACQQAAAHIGRDDRRCLASCSVRTLGKRWECRLRDSGIAANAAACAHLVAKQAMAESVPGPDDERFCGPVREMNLRGSSVRGQLNRRYDLRLHFRGASKGDCGRSYTGAAPGSRGASDDALACELACLITDSGATRQQLHATRRLKTEDSLTVFIALQDVHPDMGDTGDTRICNRAEHD